MSTNVSTKTEHARNRSKRKNTEFNSNTTEWRNKNKISDITVTMHQLDLPDHVFLLQQNVSDDWHRTDNQKTIHLLLL